MTVVRSDLGENPSECDGIVVEEDVSIVDGLNRTRLFGLDLVNAPSLDPVIKEILDGPACSDDVLPVVLTPNVDIVVQLAQSPGSPEEELFSRAQFCLPDGQPLVMVSRFMGEQIEARLPGSELFQELWPRVVADDIPTVVVASSDQIAEMLEARHPRASCVVPPMFDEDDTDAIADIVTDILAAARAVRPSLIFVGIGNPKDARIISALFDRWDPRLGQVPLCLGLGGSFSMHLGLKRRAPRLIQRIGMEWFYRFLQEPRRLFYRYFIRDMAFIGIVRREWRAARPDT
jgi:N-acetylglucosaminyldiphosphoundecaprenol N-acetyl-beta-D-mannosaminyltransferase